MHEKIGNANDVSALLATSLANSTNGKEERRLSNCLHFM